MSLAKPAQRHPCKQFMATSRGTRSNPADDSDMTAGELLCIIATATLLVWISPLPMGILSVLAVANLVARFLGL